MSGAVEPDRPRRGRAGGRAASTVAETLLWWPIAAGVWLSTSSQLSADEVAVAFGGTLGCAALAPVARRANGGRWRPRAGWLGWPVTVLAELPRQTARVWAYALSGAGRSSAISELALPAESEPTAAARRALAVLAVATTPATVVLDCASRSRCVLVHRVGVRPGALDAAVRR